jgi:hypothetical protein
VSNLWQTTLHFWLVFGSGYALAAGCIDPFLVKLRSSDPVVVAEAAKKLRPFGVAAVPALADLIETVKKPDQLRGTSRRQRIVARIEAIKTLAVLGPYAQKALPTLMAVILQSREREEDPLSDLQGRAANRAIAQVGVPAINYLIDQTRHADRNRRLVAIPLLGDIAEINPDPRIASALASLLSVDDPLITETSAMLLHNLGPAAQAEMPRLITILKNAPLILDDRTGSDREARLETLVLIAKAAMAIQPSFALVEPIRSLIQICNDDRDKVSALLIELHFIDPSLVSDAERLAMRNEDLEKTVTRHLEEFRTQGRLSAWRPQQMVEGLAAASSAKRRWALDQLVDTEVPAEYLLSVIKLLRATGIEEILADIRSIPGCVRLLKESAEES